MYVQRTQSILKYSRQNVQSVHAFHISRKYMRVNSFECCWGKPKRKKKHNLFRLDKTERSISSNIPKFDDDAARASFTTQAPLETKTMCGRIARGGNDERRQRERPSAILAQRNQLIKSYYIYRERCARSSWHSRPPPLIQKSKNILLSNRARSTRSLFSNWKIIIIIACVASTTRETNKYIN